MGLRTEIIFWILVRSFQNGFDILIAHERDLAFALLLSRKLPASADIGGIASERQSPILIVAVLDLRDEGFGNSPDEAFRACALRGSRSRRRSHDAL
jgi:hypothetical protein